MYVHKNTDNWHYNRTIIMIIILIIYGFWLRQDNNKHQTSVLHHNGANTFPYISPPPNGPRLWTEADYEGLSVAGS